MFRLLVLTRIHPIASRRLTALPCSRYMHSTPTTPPLSTPPPLPTPPAFSELNTEQENAAASAWVKAFSEAPTGISRDMVELSFSRSSGPGGQARLTPVLHFLPLSIVYRMSTKLTLRQRCTVLFISPGFRSGLCRILPKMLVH